MITISAKLSDARGLKVFHIVLQRGFHVDTESGRSIADVLTDVGVPRDYIDNRLNTVFLEGKPVDNMDTAVVHDGAIVALSAAMPGLVGAAFRKGGFYSTLRSGITHAADEIGETHTPTPAQISFKLYNFTAPEIGPLFLTQGIIVDAVALQEAFRNEAALVRESFTDILFDGRPTDMDTFLNGSWTPEAEPVRFRLKIPEHEAP